MPETIQPLPQDVIEHIAAGETIDSAAAVVRELAENALDAGATRIAIALSTPHWRVQVSDNGSGMDLENLRACACPHNTSKIQRCTDLAHIKTLGFRGLALHSIAQLADLELLSRPHSPDDAPGWQVGYDRGGATAQEKAIAIAPGTIVTVSHLFSDRPIREQGLPPLPQQLKAIQTTVYHLALAHPGVTWQLRHNNKPWFHLAPGDSASDLIPQMVRQIQPSDLQLLRKTVTLPSCSNAPTQSDRSGFQTQSKHSRPPENNPAIEGSTPALPEYLNDETRTANFELVIGLPDRCHRHRPDWVKIAVNGRCVSVPELERTILNAFARTVPQNRFPVCWLHLHVAPDRVDWNRHPAKAEIYLHELEAWQTHVTDAIAEALRLNAETLPDASRDRRTKQLLHVAEEKGAYRLNRDLESTPEPSQDAPLLELRAVAQVRNTYIVAEHPGGVWLVEQHIAHERVLYERLLEAWDLVPHEPAIVLSHLKAVQLEQLQRLGIEVDAFGDRMWAVRTVPAMLRDRSDCTEAIVELSWGGNLQAAQVATACRSAIRNGTPLSLSQMQTLLDEWRQTRHPRTCPHGRPIYLSLEETSLARFFRRHWVIGKSHGI